MRVLSLILVLAAAGCTGAPSLPPPVGLAAEIPGTTWTVERVVEADGDLGRGFAEQVAFGDDGDLRITACNDCSGRYTMTDDVLTVEPVLACTRRACPSAALPLGTILEGTSTLRRDGDYLVVANDSLNVQLLMVPAR